MVARSADLEMAPTVLKRAPIGHWKRPRRALRRSRGWPHHQGSRVTRRRSVTWTLAFGQHEDRTTHGYKPTREAAMAAFAKSWRQE
jgi:hypothetical protein